MEMRIGARNKGGYLTGETKKPDPTDPRREAWITENHRVKSSDDNTFLSGLDPVFDQVRGEILRKEPKLELEHAYAAVRREYSQKQVMDGGHRGGPPMVSESAAMMAGHRRSGEQGRGTAVILKRLFMSKIEKAGFNRGGAILEDSSGSETDDEPAHLFGLLKIGEETREYDGVKKAGFESGAARSEGRERNEKIRAKFLPFIADRVWLTGLTKLTG